VNIFFDAFRIIVCFSVFFFKFSIVFNMCLPMTVNKNFRMCLTFFIV